MRCKAIVACDSQRVYCLAVLIIEMCVCFRVRIFRQPGKRSGRHPSHERLPDRHEEAQGAAETAQGCEQTVLTLAFGADERHCSSSRVRNRMPPP